MSSTPLTDQELLGQTNAGAQFAPAATQLIDGTVVIAWLDSARVGIYAQRLDADGAAIGNEFPLASGVSYGGLPSLAASSDGGFVAVWETSGGEIHGRRFDRTGGAAGQEFDVNVTLSDEQTNPRIIVLDGGNMLVTWDTLNFDFEFQDITAQLLSPTGGRIGTEFTINTTTDGGQGISSIVPLATGGFVATWLTNTPAGSDYVQIYGQRFSASGSKIGEEFQANTHSDHSGVGVDVARLSDGGFVITWVDTVPGETGGRIVARHYNSSGIAAAGEIVIATKTSGYYGSTAVSALADGAYVVAWSNDDGSSAENHLSAQAMTADDAKAGKAFDVSESKPFPTNLSPDGLLTQTDGNIIFTWDGPSTNTSEDVYYRLFHVTPDSALVGTPGNDTLTGTAGVDVFLLQQGGNDTASGGNGNDSFYLGAALNAADRLNGNAGAADTLILQGDYRAGLRFGASNLVGIEVLVLLPGNDASFGDTAGNQYGYKLTALDANVAAGATLTVDGAGLRVGEVLIFDGSAETNGAFNIRGGRAADIIKGGGRNDILNGGAGNDRMYGGAGNDRFYVDNVLDKAIEALDGGSDTVFASVGFTLGANVEMLRLVGNSDLRGNGNGTANQLFGNAGQNLLYGNAGSDFLHGLAGNDTLVGGLHGDTLYGDAGADIFAYNSVAEFGGFGAASDIIRDFSQAEGDRIRLAPIDADTTKNGNQAFAFIGNAAFHHVAGELRFGGAGSITFVQGDVNGDATPDFMIRISGQHSLVMSDFVL